MEHAIRPNTSPCTSDCGKYAPRDIKKAIKEIIVDICQYGCDVDHLLCRLTPMSNTHIEEATKITRKSGYDMFSDVDEGSKTDREMNLLIYDIASALSARDALHAKEVEELVEAMKHEHHDACEHKNKCSCYLDMEAIFYAVRKLQIERRDATLSAQGKG